jgi:hypothetical protein
MKHTTTNDHHHNDNDNNSHHEITAKVDFSIQSNTNTSATSSITTRFTALLITGVALGVIGGLGLRQWYTSDWMTLAVRRTREGFTFPEFMGLIIAAMCIPVSFMLLFTALQRFLRHTAERIELPSTKTAVSSATGKLQYTSMDMITAPGAMTHLFVTLVCVAMLWSMAIVGFFWSWDIMRCAIVACVDTAKYPPHPDQPEYAWGFNHSIGLTVHRYTDSFTIIIHHIIPLHR